MKQEEERRGKEIDERMQQVDVVHAEHDRKFGAGHNGYNLPEELQRREDQQEKIHSIREQLEREKRKEQNLK